MRRGLPSIGLVVVRWVFSGFALPTGPWRIRSQHLTDVLSRLGPDDLCLSPWRSDGHPDHDATGHAAVAAARLTRTPVLEYLVWAWHWATPENHCRALAPTAVDWVWGAANRP